MSKREIRTRALQYVGDAKIGKATGNGGTYPQLRLPRTYAHLIGKKAHLLEITQDGQTAFLISTSDGLNSSTEGLNQSEQVLPPQLSATTASDPIIVPAPLRDTRQDPDQEAQNESFGDAFLHSHSANDCKLWAYFVLIAAVKSVAHDDRVPTHIDLCRHGGMATQPPAERLIPVRFRVSA